MTDVYDTTRNSELFITWLAPAALILSSITIHVHTGPLWRSASATLQDTSVLTGGAGGLFKFSQNENRALFLGFAARKKTRISQT